MDRRECAQQLRHLVRDAHAHARDLLTALADEQAALSSCNSEWIERAAHAKMNHIRQLETYERARQALFARAGFAADTKGAEAAVRWCDVDGTLTGAWRDFLALMTECRNRNFANGTIVEASRRQVKHALDILRAQVNEAEVYGPTGAAAETAYSRPLAKA